MVKRERDDLLVLAVALVAIPAVWRLLLGWSWPRSIAGHDEQALVHNLLSVRELATGGWDALVYRPDILGGAKARDSVGAFPLVALLARTGLAPGTVSVVAAFVVQALLAFLGSRAAVDVAFGWTGTRRTTVERLASLGLFAFAPVLAWRLGWGHVNLVVGLLPFAAALALVAAAAVRTTTITLITVSAGAFVLGLLHSGLQVVAYGAVFGAPILLGLAFSLGLRWRSLVPAMLTVLAAALLALPTFWPMLVHARSSDAPRALGADTVTYDYLTSTAGDWLSSLPWARGAISATRESGVHHEVNYPLGPVVLLLALLPWRRSRALAAGVVLALAAVLAFSMKVEPVSSALLALIPPLRSFRVPARAALPVVWAIVVLAVGTLGGPPAEEPVPRKRKRISPNTGTPAWPAIPAAILLFSAPPVIRDAAAAALVVAAVVRGARGGPLPVAALLVALAAGSVSAFRERLLPFPDTQPLIAEATSLGSAVRKARPELASPLSRVRFDLEIPAFSVNTAFAAGLSSLDGYGIPTRRFASLLFALRGQRYEPTAIFFKIPAADPAFPVLRELYDVRASVSLRQRGQLTIEPLGTTAGPAWFSASVVRNDSLAALVSELRGASGALAERAHEVLWVDGSDPLASDTATVDPRCREARVLSVDASRSGDVKAKVSTEAPCPLTFAMNFTEDLRGTAILADGRQVPLPVFPGYGPLASVLAPAGTTEVRVQPEPPRASAAWALLGVVVLLGAAWLVRTDEAQSGSTSVAAQ